MSSSPSEPSGVGQGPGWADLGPEVSALIVTAVAALTPRDGGQLGRVLEVIRRAVGADVAVALRHIDAVTVVELAGTPAQRPRLAHLGEGLFRGSLDGTECRFFDPEPAGSNLPELLQGAMALLPWESVTERRGAILLLRRGSQPFSLQERASIQALSGLLITTAREADLESATETLRARVDAISHALPCGLVFLDQNLVETWVNEAGAILLGLPKGQVPPHLMALAMASLRERALNRVEIEEQLADLFRGGQSELKHRLWRFDEPHRVLSVSCVLARRGEARGRLWAFLDVTDAQDALASMAEKNQALESARADADAANAAKSQFLANMSHEIRTPMNGVLGMTQLLRETSLSKDQREYVEVIHSSGDALLTLINDILDFSKIEAGAFELDSQPFSLRQSLAECLALLAPQASSLGLYLRHQVDADVPDMLVGDKKRLRQVLVNLAGNALKFTHEGGVFVHVSRGELREGAAPLAAPVRIAVRDTGIGIPAARMDRLFHSFSQVDASTSRQYGGTGLGLAISQRLAVMMGGSIRVESSEGKGSIFTLEIVLKEGKAAPGQASREWDATLGARHPLRILLVEDNLINQKVSMRMFQRLGYQAQVVGNGREALSAQAQEPYDVIFMDVHMPDMDGIEASKRIRADEQKYGRPRIIAMTASAIQGDRERCLQAGMNDYVTKPVDTASIAAALEKASVAMHGTPVGAGASEKAQEPALAPVLEQEALGKLALLVDRNELGALVRDFLRNSGLHVDSMRLALEAGDKEELARRAHSLRSSAALFGASRLSSVCVELEALAQEGPLERVKGLVESAVSAYEAARAALEVAVPEARSS